MLSSAPFDVNKYTTTATTVSGRSVCACVCSGRIKVGGEKSYPPKKFHVEGGGGVGGVGGGGGLHNKFGPVLTWELEDLAKLRGAKKKVHPLKAWVGVKRLRDWSLITGRGGGYKMGKLRVRNFFCPPPSPRQGKTFHAPPFKEWKPFTPPPTIWLKLQLSYCVKTTPKHG